jgi:hypothetical protein
MGGKGKKGKKKKGAREEPEPEDDYMKITVKHGHRVVFFKMSKDSTFEKLFDTYTLKFPTRFAYEFILDGVVIKKDDTPVVHGLCDEIEVRTVRPPVEGRIGFSLDVRPDDQTFMVEPRRSGMSLEEFYEGCVEFDEKPRLPHVVYYQVHLMVNSLVNICIWICKKDTEKILRFRDMLSRGEDENSNLEFFSSKNTIKFQYFGPPKVDDFGATKSIVICMFAQQECLCCEKWAYNCEEHQFFAGLAPQVTVEIPFSQKESLVDVLDTMVCLLRDKKCYKL